MGLKSCDSTLQEIKKNVIVMMQAGFEIFIHTEKSFLALLTYLIFNDVIVKHQIQRLCSAACSKDR